MTLPGSTESCTKGTKLAPEASTIGASESDRSAAHLLERHDNQCLSKLKPAGQALLQTTDVALIHLHSAREQITPRSYHGAAQFMQQCPGVSYLFQSQHPLQSQCAGPVSFG